VLRRAVIAATLIVGVSLLVQRASGAESVPPRAPLSTLSLTFGGWVGHELPAWDDEVMKVLGADEYVNRRYIHDRGIAELYIGYYRSQRQGDSIHSPQNCLPGAGWQPVASGTVTIPIGSAGARSPASRSITVNRYVIQKDFDKQVVLYWFQGRGRVVASEYANRAYLVLDSLRTRRSDGALVRVISPVLSSADEASRSAERFAAALYPKLSEVIP
jgi:EpsI family protein